MYTATTAPPSKPPKPSGASSSPAGGITHEDVPPQALKPATATASPRVPAALLAGAAFSYAKGMGDDITLAPKPVLAALRIVPTLVLLLTTRNAPGIRAYARGIQWGLLLCAVGDLLIELDPLAFIPVGSSGRHVRLLSCGLALFMLAHAAYARAFAADMPSPLRLTGARAVWVGWELGNEARNAHPPQLTTFTNTQHTGAHVVGPALLLLAYRAAEFSLIMPTPVTGFSAELLGFVTDAKRLRMLAYTTSTSLLFLLACARNAPPRAASGSKVWAMVGCAFFVMADTLLTYTRFVKPLNPFPFSEGVFLELYFWGQTCIAMSVPAWGTTGKGEGEGAEQGKEETKEKPVRATRRRKSRKVE